MSHPERKAKPVVEGSRALSTNHFSNDQRLMTNDQKLVTKILFHGDSQNEFQ